MKELAGVAEPHEEGDRVLDAKLAQRGSKFGRVHVIGAHHFW